MINVNVDVDVDEKSWIGLIDVELIFSRKGDCSGNLYAEEMSFGSDDCDVEGDRYG